MLRRILIGVSVLLALLVVAAVAVATLVDANRFKPQIERFVQERYQRNLHLDGDLALSVFPKFALSLPPATLSDRGGTGEAASIAGAKLGVAVLPLLRGEIVADKVTVQGLKTTIERRADGSLSIDDLIGAGEPAAAPAQPGATDPPSRALPRFDLGGFALTGGQVTYRDQQAGRTITVDQLALDTGRIANKGETPVTVNLTFAATQPETGGKLSLKALAQMDVDSKVYGAKNVDATLEASSGTRRLDAAHITLTSVTTDPGRMAVDLVGLAFEARGKLDADVFETRVSAPRLALTENSASGETLQASVQLTGSRVLQANIEARGIGGVARALTLDRLAIEASTKQGAQAVQAKLATPVKANLPGGAFELSGLAGSVSIEDPGLPQKAASVDLTGTVSLDTQKETLSADLNAKSLETTLLAKVQVNGFSQPKVEMNLNADQLDLDRFVPATPGGGGAGSQSAGGNTGSASGGGTTAGAPGQDAPVDLSALRDLDGSGSLSVGRLRARGVELSDLRVKLKAAQGRLDADPVSASLYGGRLAATTVVQAGATPAANRIDAHADLTGISIGPLLRDVAAKDLLEGQGNLKLALNTGGGTVDAMKRGLDGRAALDLRNGAIKGINLGESIRSARSLLRGGGQSETKPSDARKQTDFTEFDVSFVIADGIATSTDLDVKSPLLRIGGEGRADLVGSRLDYTVRASVVGTSTGQGGKDLADVRGVTVPVRLTGPFDKLDWQIDWETAGKEALKGRAAAELRERLKTDDIEGKARERVNDALKGLFKR